MAANASWTQVLVLRMSAGELFSQRAVVIDILHRSNIQGGKAIPRCSRSDAPEASPQAERGADLGRYAKARHKRPAVPPAQEAHPRRNARLWGGQRRGGVAVMAARDLGQSGRLVGAGKRREGWLPPKTR